MTGHIGVVYAIYTLITHVQQYGSMSLRPEYFAALQFVDCGILTHIKYDNLLMPSKSQTNTRFPLIEISSGKLPPTREKPVSSQVKVLI